MQELVLGIDVGGTNTKFGLVNKQGEIIAEGSCKTKGHPQFKDYLAHLMANVEQVSNTIPSYKLVGVGVGAPNGNYYRGTIEEATNLEWKGIVYFTEQLKDYFADMPIILTNDANAAAIGEMTFGSARGMKNFIVFTLGTGLGSGIVANGEVIYGADGFAGEIGHTLVNVFGRTCGCGRKGCLETYVSATGIKRTVYKLLADYVCDSELRGVSFNDLSGHMITEAALRGDFIAQQAFEYTGRVLGMKLADTVAHFSPEAIFLFGGLVNAGDHLLKPAKYHMEDNMLRIFKGKVKLLVSGLQNKNAAVLGASSLVWKELAKNQ
ncbi:MAG: ROK family protein [Cyclobacteriaceae bacterium]|nr:ROK family protein [Cyclobacteriaceae bacterium]